MTRIAVITGAGTGIGAQAALQLADSCTDLVLVGRRLEKLEATKAAIAQSHPQVKVSTHSVDITDLDAVQAFADEMKSAHGRIDILVNNAGSTQPKIDGDLKQLAAVWDSTLRGNLLSVVYLTEALLPLMASPGGRIVIVGSFASISGNGSVAYTVAKGALESYAVTLCRNFGPKGITANVVAPGYTGDTELVVGRISPERHEKLVSGIAIGRAATSEEIASLIVYLASERASFVNGQTVFANGGMLFPG